MEDLIPEEDVVVTITRGGYAKRTRVDQYRSQKRGGKGVRGASLRGEDVVEHFFTTTTHHWLLFFTNLGRVYRAKAYELPEGSAATARASTSPTCSPSSRASRSPRCSPSATTRRPTTSCSPPARAWSRRPAWPTTTPTAPAASSRSTCARATSSSAPALASNRDDLLLVSRKGQSVRFTATDEALRPMGRSTSGVTGMKFRDGDDLLAMSVVEEGESPDVFVVFENGLAKRTPVSEYRLQGRGGLGIKVAKLSDKGGDLVGALTVERDRRGPGRHGEGQDRPLAGRRGAPHRPDTSQGVKFATPDKGDSIVAVARNAESRDRGRRDRGRQPGGAAVRHGSARYGSQR